MIVMKLRGRRSVPLDPHADLGRGARVCRRVRDLLKLAATNKAAREVCAAWGMERETWAEMGARGRGGSDTSWRLDRYAVTRACAAVALCHPPVRSDRIDRIGSTVARYRLYRVSAPFAFAPRGYCHGARPRSRLFTVLFVFLFVPVCVRSCHSCPRVLIIARHDLVATPQALQDVLLRAAAPRFYFGRPRSGWVGV